MRRFHVILLSSACGASAHAATPPWTVSEASGGALVMHQGVIRAAHRNDRLVAGDTVMTGANARAVLVRGEEYAVVAPSSRLQVADPAATGGLVQMVERFGNVVFSIKKMATPHFGVQTPYLAAVVKGTTFSVTVGDGDAAVQVVEGAVEVATNDGRERDLVHPGGVAHVSSSDLGHLVVRGDTTPVSHAATRPAATGAATATHTARSAGDATGLTVVASLPHDADVAIPAMEEAPQSIAGLSGGLIAGDTAMRLAVAATGASAADRRVEIAAGLIAPAGSTAPIASAPPAAPVTPVSAAPGAADPTPSPPAATPPVASTPPVATPVVTPVAAPPAVTAPVETPPPSTPIAAPIATPPAVTTPVATPPVATTPVPTTPVVTTPVATPPVTTAPVVTTPVTMPPVTTPPVVAPPPATPPVTTPPVTTPPVTTPPVTTPPVTTAPTTPSGTGVTVGIGPGGITITPGSSGTGVSLGGGGSIISIGFGDNGRNGGSHGGTDNGKGNAGMNNGLQLGKLGK